MTVVPQLSLTTPIAVPSSPVEVHSTPTPGPGEEEEHVPTVVESSDESSTESGNVTPNPPTTPPAPPSGPPAAPLGDVEDMAVAYQVMKAVVEQHKQTVEKASPRSPRSPKSIILEEPTTPPELGDRKDEGGESVDPAYLSVKGRIDLFQNKATVSPRSTASGSGLRPTGMTPRSAPEAESIVMAPAAAPEPAIPPTEGNVIDNTGQRPIFIGAPAI